MSQNLKRDNQFKRRGPIDGISSRGSVRFNQGGSNSLGASSGPRPQGSHARQQSNVLNDFRRSDGFHPNKQQQILPTPQAHSPRPQAQETFVIDRKQAPQHKRGLFGKKKYSGQIKTKKKRSKKKKVLLTFLVLFIIATLIGGFLVFKGYITLRKVLPGGGGAAALQQNVDPSKLNGEGDGRVNILLLGRGGEGHDGPDLTDTIILVSIDPLAKEAALVSIPRDLYVPVGNMGSMKINSVYATGKTSSNTGRISVKDDPRLNEAGFKLLEDTIQETLGLPIHYRFMVDFAGFEQAVNNVGGVNFYAPQSVTETMRINGQNYKLDVKEGQQQMDGFEALAYARSRHTSPRGDFDRAERQRALITALKDKILSPSTFSNPQKISNLLGTFGDHVQTNFAVQDLQRLYQLSQEIPSDKISSIGLADPPNNFLTTSSIGGTSIVIPAAGQSDFAPLQSYLRNVLKDSYLKNENANIMVLNGTTKAGLASTKGDELKSFGYNITQVANAPTKNYPKTVIVDMRAGQKKYTLSYLEKRFGVTVVSQIPDPAISPGEADFVIILGNDQVSAN